MCARACVCVCEHTWLSVIFFFSFQVYMCFVLFVFVFLRYLVIDTNGWLTGIWHLPYPAPQPPHARGHLHDFPSHLFLFNPFCVSPLYSPSHTMVFV